MKRQPSPVMLRQRVGRRLFELRKQHDLTMTQAAQRIDKTQSWISKMESGHPSMQPSSIRLLLMSYGCSPDEVDDWAGTVRDAMEQSWWESGGYQNAIFEDFADYLSAEAAVTRMSYFHLQLIPGVVQTADYARALLDAQLLPERRDEIDAIVELRMARHQYLVADNGPQLRMVLDYPAVHRPIGGRTVMREQLAHLLKLAKRPNIQLQILSPKAGAEVAYETSFIYLEFHGDPDFVYTESVASGLYIRDADEVQQHRIAFERLQSVALSSRASVTAIKKAMEDLE